MPYRAKKTVNSYEDFEEVLDRFDGVVERYQHGDRVYSPEETREMFEMFGPCTFRHSFTAVYDDDPRLAVKLRVNLSGERGSLVYRGELDVDSFSEFQELLEGEDWK